MPFEHRRQVNVRLSTSDAEILATVAYLSGRSATEVVRPVVEGFLHKENGNPDVQAALKIRAIRSSAKE